MAELSVTYEREGSVQKIHTGSPVLGDLVIDNSAIRKSNAAVRPSNCWPRPPYTVSAAP